MNPGDTPAIYENKEDKQLARILSTLIRATWVAYLFLILTNLYYKDWVLIAVALAGCVLLIAPWVLLRRGHLRASSLIVVLGTLGIVTILATVGQGIRDLGIVAFPIVFIFAGLTLDRRLFKLCIGLALVAVTWLALGETYGWFVTKPFDGEMSNWVLLIGAIIILLVAALAVDLLATNMRESLELAHQEIAQRIQVEAALQNSERRLQALIENGLDYISLLDGEGNLLWESPSSTNLLGYRFNEFLGRNIFETMHPADLEWTSRQFIEVANEPGSRRAGVFRLRHADGSWRWVEAIVSNFLQDPAVGAIIINYRDITERKLAKEHARHNEIRYRQAITAAGAVPYYRDYQKESHTYTFMGEGILQLTGYSAAEITPAIFDQQEQECVMRGSLAHLTPDEADRLSEAGEIQEWTCDYRILTRDGNVRWVADSAIQIRDENNRRLGVIGILQDITERKRTEEALQEKEVQYHNLADSGIALIWTAGTDKLCNYFNLPWLKFTGRTLEQELGNGWAEGVHPDDFDRCLETYVTAFDKREAFDMDYRLHHVSGEYRWLRDLGTPNYNSAGEFVGYIGHCFDITERKRMEEQLRHQGTHDILTGLYNRAYFETELARLEHSREFPVSVIMVDVDKLKVANDTQGHAAGDELLRRTAGVLGLIFREGDVLARVGGDEFAMLLPNTNAATAEQMLVRIKAKLAEHNAEHCDLPVQLSLGAASAEKNNLAEAFRVADRRMYTDKAARKANENL